MILSRLHEFIFIKGLKVGGTSVEIALSALCGPDDIVTPITPIDELRRLRAIGGGARNYATSRATELLYLDKLRKAAISELLTITPPTSPFVSHMTLREVLQLTGPESVSYRVVCVERNPYAKIISWANHKLSFASYQVGGDMRADIGNLRRFLHEATENRSIIAVKNIDRYRGPRDTMPDEILRFERLALDLQTFLLNVGIDNRVELPHAKRGIQADQINPRDFFNKSGIAVINEMFREEFETFGYVQL